MVDILAIFPIESYRQERFQKLNLLTEWIYFAIRVIIYFWNKLPNQIKNSISVWHFKIKLDNFRKNGNFDLYVDML